MYQATGDFLILRPIKADTRSAGGIVLPDQSKEKFGDNAVVVSVGPEVSQDFQIGDVVLRPDPARIEISDPRIGDILLVVAEEDIVAKMVPDA
jgi:chaperonin GroES